MNKGRNDPCPCGSGQKYKKCCGAQGRPAGQPEMLTLFKSNLQKKYSGTIGKIREADILYYTGEKQRGIHELEEDQKTQAAANGEKLSCRKGCISCCYFFADATPQECDAIVYYLFRHGDVLEAFIKNYPLWRIKAKKVDRKFDELGQSNNKEEFISRLKSALREYHGLNIPCPFLVDGTCSIHEIRPWVCAGVVAVSPSEWCNPSDPNYLRVKYVSSDVLLDKEPAFSKPTMVRSVESSMPASVFRLLREV